MNKYSVLISSLYIESKQEIVNSQYSQINSLPEDIVILYDFPYDKIHEIAFIFNEEVSQNPLIEKEVLNFSNGIIYTLFVTNEH